MGSRKQSYGKAVGRQVKALRTQQRMSQEQLAIQTGVDRSYISLLERGKVEEPGLGQLLPLASYFGVSVEELTGRQGAALAVLPEIRSMTPTEQVAMVGLWQWVSERLRRLPPQAVREGHAWYDGHLDLMAAMTDASAGEVREGSAEPGANRDRNSEPSDDAGGPR